jgi:hypothetical protein
MKESKGVWASLAALLPALILAATGWMEAKTASEEKFEALDSYRAYIEDQMLRDDHTEEALASCLRSNEHLVAAGRPAPCEPCPPCAELHPADYPTVASPAPEGP